METKVEGILISKVPYKERDIIGTLLLRSGKQISVLFYGGRGGGVKKKSSIVELGFMLKVELRNAKKTAEMFTAKEWSVMWSFDQIRLNHKAFYQLCFYLEVIRKISAADDLFDELAKFDEGSTGIFRVLSNAIYYLEDALKADCFRNESFFVLFLAKILMEEGVFPELKGCTICGVKLNEFDRVHLMAERGGPACPICSNDASLEGYTLYQSLLVAWNMKYSEYKTFPLVGHGEGRELFNYFCYQMQFSPNNFKSISLVI